jgi:hypothetical protein
MHGNVIGLVTLDFELWFIFAGMVYVALVLRIARVDLDYPAGHKASLGIPANVIAEFKVRAHVSVPPAGLGSKFYRGGS